MASDCDVPPAGEAPLRAYAMRLERAGRHAEAEEAYAAHVAAHPRDTRALARRLWSTLVVIVKPVGAAGAATAVTPELTRVKLAN